MTALQATDLSVETGELVAVLGPNGAGKSTLLRSIMGLVRGSSGTVAFEGTRIDTLPTAARAGRGVVLVPEGRGIFGPMTVEENLLLGGYLGRDAIAIKQRRERVFALFPRLAERLRQVAGSMSGGEQQMLAIGRALMGAPRLLMLDEPSMGLAPLFVEEIFSIIAALKAEGTTILLVEQNASAALDVADQAYVLETGRIVLSGPAAEVARDPAVAAAYLGG